MKKILLILICSFAISAYAQVETAPNATSNPVAPTETDSIVATWMFPCAAFIGEYGVNTNGTDIYVSQWLGDSLARYDSQGNVIETFTIPGVERVRDMAFDGQYYYGSPNDFFFYVLDLDNKTLVNTVNVSFKIRGLTYDPVENVLWASEHWTPHVYKMDLQGNILDQWMPTGVTMEAISGLAIDNVTAGGPFLWGFSQEGTGAMIIRYDIAAQAQSGTIIDVTQLPGVTSIAGGLFISELLLDSDPLMGGMIQNEWVFSFDLAYANTLVNIENNEMLPEMEVYPNPVQDVLNITISTVDAEITCTIYNQTGQKVRERVLQQGDDGKVQINTSELSTGMYFFSITSSKGYSLTKKIVKAE